MYIEALNRQIAVCSFEGAARLISFDKHYWNVVSIHGPLDRKAILPLAKSIHYACFDDIETENSTIYRSPTAADLAGIFAFVKQLDEGDSRPPLLIHCQQGISRSAAVALAWTYRSLQPTGDRASIAIDVLLQLRPEAKPNYLVLALGLGQFMSAPEARDRANRMVSEPRLQRNRFQTPLFGSR